MFLPAGFYLLIGWGKGRRRKMKKLKELWNVCSKFQAICAAATVSSHLLLPPCEAAGGKRKTQRGIFL